MIGRLLRGAVSWITGSPISAALVVAVSTIVVLSIQAKVLRSQLDERTLDLVHTELELENREARAGRTIEWLVDSLRAVEVINQQLEQVGDERLEEVDRIAQVNALLRVEIAAVSGTTSGDVTTGTDDIRIGIFRDYLEPITLSATVRLPADGTGTMAWEVALDAINLKLEIACEPLPGRLIQRATATLLMPPWMEATMVVRQREEVCNQAVFQAAKETGGGVGWWLPVATTATGFIAGGLDGALLGAGVGVAFKLVF